MTYPLAPIPENIEKIFAAGGDGTVREVLLAMLKGNNSGFLFTNKGGSQNVLDRSLTSIKSIATVDQIHDNNLAHIPDFYPGQIINVETRYIFPQIAELGNQIKLFGNINEGLRNSNIPRTLRGFVAAAKFIFRNREEETNINPSFNLFAVGPYIGALRLISMQDLYADDITKLTLQDKNSFGLFRNALILSAFLTANISPPASVYRIEKKNEFVLSNEGQFDSVGLGGDFFPLPTAGDIYISRSEKSIKAAAIV